MSPTLSDEDLCKEAASGELAGRLAVAGRDADAEARTALEGRLRDLHNQGALDLLALVESGAVTVLPDGETFWAIEVLADLIPDLDADVGRMLRAVERLATEGEGYRGGVTAPFRAWCGKDEARARGLQAMAEAGDPVAARYAVFALEILGSIPETRRLAREARGDLRLAALTALSRLTDADAASRQMTFAALEGALDAEPNDALRANVIQAAAGLLATPATAPVAAAGLAVLGRALAEPSADVLFQCAHVLWRQGGKLAAPVVQLLLSALSAVQASQKGVLRQADLALKTLLDHGHEDLVLAWLERRLQDGGDPLRLEDLPALTRDIAGGPPQRLSRIVVRWLRTSSGPLCDGLSHALGSREHRRAPVDLLVEDLDLPAQDLADMAATVAGYFLLQPNLACGLIVSLLRAAPDAAAPAIQQVLENILLLNYGSLRDPLADLAADDPAAARVQAVLIGHDAYLAALETVPTLVELRPSESQRRIERLRRVEEGREISKAAEAQSIFGKLVTRTVLLYGRSARTFVHAPDGARAVDIEMKRHGVSMEMPRLEVIDPVALDYHRRVLRGRRRS